MSHHLPHADDEKAHPHQNYSHKGVGCGESSILVCEEWKNKAGEKGGAMMGARQKKSQDIFYVKELV